MSESVKNKEILLKSGEAEVRRSQELRQKFFFHWALLSGTTIILMFPLIKELVTSLILKGVEILITGIFLVIFSLILSSFRAYATAVLAWKIGMADIHDAGGDGEPSTDKHLNELRKNLEKIEIFSIFSYPLGLIMIVVFISLNII